jgi:hypothetical protein
MGMDHQILEHIEVWPIEAIFLKWRGGSRSITNLLFKRRQLMVSTVI